MKTNPRERFIDAIAEAARDCHETSRAHGFWQEGHRRNKGEMIALMHSELSEALEAIRKPGRDKHCPEFDALTAELADTVIRVLDFAGGFNLPLGEAIIAKMDVNRNRPYKHGKAF